MSAGAFSEIPNDLRFILVGHMRPKSLALPAVALALGLAACGGSDPQASAADAANAADTARVKFTQCLRKNGLDVPDTQPGQNGGRGGFGARLRNQDAATVRKAMQACRKEREQAFGTVTPQQRQEFRDAFVKFSACMRQHGVNLPDPGQNGPGGAGPPAGGRRLPDPGDPNVRAAMQACRDKLPQGGRFGPGRGPGGAN